MGPINRTRNNVHYKPRNLIIKFICERASFETARPGAIFWMKFIYLKLDINIICYTTVHRAKMFVEDWFCFAQKQGNEVQASSTVFVLCLEQK